MSSPNGKGSLAASAPAPAGGFTHRQILTILTGLMLGMFLAALDQTIVASAIRTIGDDLDGLSIQAWVTTAYLITSTISTPLYGKLSDLYGRKPFFLCAISIFIVGSAASSFSTSMYMLAIFRAFQGLGAGGLFSMALAIMGDIVSPRERARYRCSEGVCCCRELIRLPYRAVCPIHQARPDSVPIGQNVRPVQID